MKDDWLPIETAPRDGTRILLFRPPGHPPDDTLRLKGQIVCGAWDADQYSKAPRPYWGHDAERWLGRKNARDRPPTHWMPLEPPRENQP